MKIRIYTKSSNNPQIFDNLDSKSIDVDFLQPIREHNCITINGTEYPTSFPLSEILSLEVWLDGEGPPQELVQKQFDEVLSFVGSDLAVKVFAQQ